MSTTHLLRKALIAGIAASFLLTGAVRNAEAVGSAAGRNGPPCECRESGPQQLTQKQVKELAARASSPEDHLKLASYYKAEANRLDAEAASYDEAAATYAKGPLVKNIMALNTAARYEQVAKDLRDQAKSNRELAAAHEKAGK